MINFPDSAPIKTVEKSMNELVWGRNNNNPGDIRYKLDRRWKGKPTTFLLDDVDIVLSALFAQERLRDSEYRRDSIPRAINNDITLMPTDSFIDVLTNIWDDILPHVKLNFEDDKIMALSESSIDYHGKEMSDGERVVLYLIGQCLLVESGSIIIIDEPEIHLHRSLMNRLWNKIEEIKPNCLLVYITHDLDFAASRVNSSKLWIKNYYIRDETEEWDWDLVPDQSEFPESLILEIMGNKKNVLFIEGEVNSLDFKIYRKIYTNFLIKPVGSCEKVITSTKSMGKNSLFNHLKFFGIVDRDFRTEEELEALKTNNIFSLEVAEIENLLCTKEILKVVSNHLDRNFEEIFENVKNFVFEEINRDLERQVSRQTARIIQNHLKNFNGNVVGESELKKSLTNEIQEIDVSSIYNKNREHFQKILNTKDYNDCLKIYKEKSILKRISRFFGFRDGELEQQILNYLDTDKRDEYIKEFKIFVPSIVQ